MFKFGVGLVVGLLLRAKFGEPRFDEVRHLAQQASADERVGGLVRAVTAAAGDAVRVLGIAVTEESRPRRAVTR